MTAAVSSDSTVQNGDRLSHVVSQVTGYKATVIDSSRRFSLKETVLGNVAGKFGYPLVVGSSRIEGTDAHRTSGLKFRRRRCYMSYSATDGTVEMT